MDDKNLDKDIDVNEENEKLYKDLMNETKRKNDGYWDINNPVIKILLTVLLIIAVVGTIYYIIVWTKTM